MSTLTIPNTFSPLTTAQSALVNANFSATETAVNNIDNTNIGALGIYASQVIPTSTAQATFGGSFGYTFYPNSTGQVPLTVSGTSGQSADLFDVTLTSGGAKALYVDSAGSLHLGFAISGAVNATGAIAAGSNTGGTLTGGDLGASRSTSTGLIRLGGSVASATIDFGVTHAGDLNVSGAATTWVANFEAQNATFSGTIRCTSSVNAGWGNAPILTAGDLGAARSTTTGALILGGSSSSGTLDYGVTTASVFTVNKPFAAMADGSHAAYVPPVYNATGTAVASTTHVVQGAVTASGATTTVTLSGAAAFSGGTGTAYFVVIYDLSNGSVATLNSATSSSFTFASTSGHLYMYFAVGS